MDLRLDIERRKRFSAKEYKQEGDKGSGGSHGPSPEKSSDKAAKHHKKSKYVDLLCVPVSHLPSHPVCGVLPMFSVCLTCSLSFTGRARRDVSALPPPRPPPPPLQPSGGKPSWRRGWSTWKG